MSAFLGFEDFIDVMKSAAAEKKQPMLVSAELFRNEFALTRWEAKQMLENYGFVVKLMRDRTTKAEFVCFSHDGQSIEDFLDGKINATTIEEMKPAGVTKH